MKGIPPRIAEAIETETCLNSPTVEAPPEEEPSQRVNGDENSVFPDQLVQLGSVVGGFDDFQTWYSTGELDQTIQLPANSFVSCRVTPTSETTLSFQWNKQDQINSKNCSG